MTKKLIVMLLLGVCVGCAPNSGSTTSSRTNDNDNTEQGTPPPEAAPGDPGTDPAPPVTTPPASQPAADFWPPLWEKARKEGKEWTRYVLDLQKDILAGLYDGSDDVQSFCPSFFKMNRAQRENFWAVLAGAIVKYESAFEPVSRYVETTMGTDPITGRQVASEGLMQLSYQDGRSYSFCNEFDWSKDKGLAVKDPAKTIFDPKKNLKCGLQILQYQIRRLGKIAPAKGNYWAVLIPGGKYTSLPAIQAITRAMPACK